MLLPYSRIPSHVLIRRSTCYLSRKKNKQEDACFVIDTRALRIGTEWRASASGHAVDHEDRETLLVSRLV
jgi:hypothetical protein